MQIIEKISKISELDRILKFCPHPRNPDRQTNGGPDQQKNTVCFTVLSQLCIIHMKKLSIK